MHSGRARTCRRGAKTRHSRGSRSGTGSPTGRRLAVAITVGQQRVPAVPNARSLAKEMRLRDTFIFFANYFSLTAQRSRELDA